MHVLFCLTWKIKATKARAEREVGLRKDQANVSACETESRACPPLLAHKSFLYKKLRDIFVDIKPEKRLNS